MNMPLRSAADKEALIKGLDEGVIDCIASDHAPHEYDSKRREFESAAFGIIGLQTTLPLTLALVKSGALELSRAIEVLSVGPRKCFKLEPVSIKAGAIADLTLIDLHRSFALNKSCNQSKSTNSPFWEQDLEGSAVATFVGGKCVFEVNQSGQ
jgi:dihydroorotase